MKFIRELVKKKTQQTDDFVQQAEDVADASAADLLENRTDPSVAKPTLKIKAPNASPTGPADDLNEFADQTMKDDASITASASQKAALDSIVSAEKSAGTAAGSTIADDNMSDQNGDSAAAQHAEEAGNTSENSLWADDGADDASTSDDPSDDDSNVIAVPMPAAGRARRRSGRVKTRLLGFEHSDGEVEDVFDKEKKVPAAGRSQFPVGWLVIIEGPGCGEAFSLLAGVSQIGRGEEETIALDFGDNSISRNNHAAIAFDEEQTKFFLGHGGKSNIVRLNDKPVLSTEEMTNGDIIRIGETTLQFVALCGETFSWADKKSSDVVSIS